MERHQACPLLGVRFACRRLLLDGRNVDRDEAIRLVLDAESILRGSERFYE